MQNQNNDSAESFYVIKMLILQNQNKISESKCQFQNCIQNHNNDSTESESKSQKHNQMSEPKCQFAESIPGFGQNQNNDPWNQNNDSDSTEQDQNQFLSTPCLEFVSL